jgi:hypothetical protein
MDAAVGRLAIGRLDLVAPERPVFLPGPGNVVFLEAGRRQHVLPVFDVQHLLLQHETVEGLLAGLAVIEVRGVDRGRQEPVLHRLDDVGNVFELAVEGPLGRDPDVV